MKVYTFKIIEDATYSQTGTVSVEAKTLKEAKKLVIGGDYEHSGDNEIDYNTERNVRNREILEYYKD